MTVPNQDQGQYQQRPARQQNAQQFRPTSETSQPGSAYGPGLQRFSYTGDYYGFSFSGSTTYGDSTGQYAPQPGGPPSAPQSDVRSQPDANGHARNTSAGAHARYYSQAPQQPHAYSPNMSAARAAPSSSGFQNQYNVQDQQQHGAPQRSGYASNSGQIPGSNAPQPSPRATQMSPPAGHQSSARALPHPLHQQQPHQHHPRHEVADPSTPQTVDPSQFHDSYREMQRRRALEAEAAALREEQARKEAEERTRSEQEQKQMAEAILRKSQEDKRRSEQAQAVEQQLEQQKQRQNQHSSPSEQELEEEMKATFLKLRQLNQRDPTLLSKLWAQERENHLASQSPKTQHATPQGGEPTSREPMRKPQAASADQSTKKKPARSPQEKTKAKAKVKAQSQPQPPQSVASAPAASRQPQTQPPPRVQAPSSNAPPAPATSPHALPTTKPVNSIWPNDKKTLLSVAASRLLQATAGNNGQTILPSDISMMLDKNPTYVELCDSIEKKGFKINRASFAKGLLSHVPDNRTVPGASPSGTTLPPAPQGVSPAPLAPATGNPTNSPESQNTPDRVLPVSSPNENDQAVKGKSQKSQKAVAKGKVSALTSPPTKEDMARKRAFADLVDLTQLSDEESSKKFQTDALSQGRNGQNATTNPTAVTSTAYQPQSFKESPKIPMDHPLRNQRAALPLDRHKAIRRSKYNPKTIARDVLLACGRHPHMRPLNAHLDVLKTAAVSLREDVDLETLQWDIIDPGGLPVGAGMPNEPTMVELDDFADDESDSSSEFEVIASAPAAITVGGAATAAMVPSSRFGPNPSSIKKRGEPGGLDSRTPKSGVRKHASRDTQTPGSVSAYSELRKMNERAGIPARRGRPVGWRKHMQKMPDGSFGKASAGKPAKRPPPSPPEPNFPEFKCEWEGCDRVLHNLDTLRRHIIKLHRSERHTCKWDDCGKVEAVSDGQRTTSRKVRHALADATEWRSHIEGHLTTVAWRLGDGPAAGLAQHPESASEQSETYMSDKDGRQITPRVEMPSGRGFTAVNVSSSGRTSGSQRAQEEVRGAEERRARLGVGIDHGGARSVDDAMRATMKDDGDSDTPAMEVVDDEDMPF